MEWGDLKKGGHQTLKTKINKTHQTAQKYPSLDVEPSGPELGDLGLAAQRLWDLDLDKLAANQEYQINVQDGKWYFYGYLGQMTMRTIVRLISSNF